MTCICRRTGIDEGSIPLHLEGSLIIRNTNPTPQVSMNKASIALNKLPLSNPIITRSRPPLPARVHAGVPSARAFTPARHGHHPLRLPAVQHDHKSMRLNSDSQRDYPLKPSVWQPDCCECIRFSPARARGNRCSSLEVAARFDASPSHGLTVRREILQVRLQLTGAKAFQDRMRCKRSERLKIRSNDLFRARFDDEVEVSGHDDIGV